MSTSEADVLGTDRVTHSSTGIISPVGLAAEWAGYTGSSSGNSLPGAQLKANPSPLAHFP